MSDRDTATQVTPATGPSPSVDGGAQSGPSPLQRAVLQKKIQRRALQRQANAAGGEQAGAPKAGEASAAHPAGAMAGPQHTRDLDALYREAEKVHPALVSVANKIAAECGGEAKVPGLKERDKALSKINADYGGDASRITDLARGSVVLKKLSEVEKAKKSIPANTKVTRVKDRFGESADGYRDMLYNIEIGGHICELQVQLEAIQKVKSGDGHKLYEQVREIERAAREAHRDLTPEEAATIQELRKQMKGKYDAAFESAKDV